MVVPKRRYRSARPSATAQDFSAAPGLGVSARLAGAMVQVGSRRVASNGFHSPEIEAIESRGKTLLWVTIDGQVAGVLAQLPEVVESLTGLKLDELVKRGKKDKDGK